MSFVKESNVTVMVADMDAAIAFYTDVLGFTLKSRYDNHWAEINAPGITLGFHLKGKDVTVGNSLSIGFSVEHIHQVVADMKTKGVDCRLQEDGPVILAYFTDPDDNPLYFSQSIY